jgi:hypothetical protein
MLDMIFEYWNIFTTVVTLASMVAAVTPTKKDDEVISKIKSAINLVALNVGNARTK